MSEKFKKAIKVILGVSVLSAIASVALELIQVPAIAWTVAAQLPAVYMLWLGFVAVMTIKEKYRTGDVKKGVYYAAFPAAVVLLMIDVGLRFTFGLLYGIPRNRDPKVAHINIPLPHFTLSALFRQWRREHDSGWRVWIADRVCICGLNPFDSEHC